MTSLKLINTFPLFLKSINTPLFQCFIVLVAPGKDDMEILGLPDAVEAGTKVELTCIVKRIKPLASDIHWILNGQRLSSIGIETKRNEDKTHEQLIKLDYRQSFAIYL